MLVISRKFEFDAGHRILNHESKCAHLHGHRYVAEVFVYNHNLDGLGRVIDYGLIKSIVGKWIDDNWDHNFLFHPEDPLLKALQLLDRQAARGKPVNLDASNPLGQYSKEVFGGKVPYVFPPKTNPTAENIAMVLLREAHRLLCKHVDVVGVTIHETPNCAAMWGSLFSLG